MISKYNFLAIPLNTIVSAFILTIILVLLTINFVIEPLTSHNTSEQTFVIIGFFSLLFAIALYWFKKISKPILIEINPKADTIIIYINNQIYTPKNIGITDFIFKKTLSYSLILDEKSYLIFNKKSLETGFNKNDIKQELILFKSEVSRNSRYQVLPIFSLPRLVNYAFYFIIILGIASFVVLLWLILFSV